MFPPTQYYSMTVSLIVHHGISSAHCNRYLLNIAKSISEKLQLQGPKIEEHG